MNACRPRRWEPRLIIAFGFLILIILLLVLYISILKRQLHSINHQLGKRLKGDTRAPIRLELINRELNHLTSNINKSLKAEETLRLNGVMKEKKFRELIANISHDLRTPLTAIKGYLQLMDNGDLMEEQQKKLQIARKHADELGLLVEHFFEYSYLIDAESKLNIRKINLTNLVAECLVAFVSDFEKRGLMVQYEEEAPVYILADHEMMVRIINNLIRNCVTHSISDVKVQITTSDIVRMSFKNLVENAGEIDVNRLFDRFYTRDQARSKTTGLGLSIVRLLAEQMDGRANASLQENEFMVEVELPLYK